MYTAIKAPMPWFGGKSGAAPLVWERLGKVDNIVDAFCGSAAFVLGYPYDNQPTITMNDLDGFVSNFFRAVTMEPDAVASWLDFPVSEIDLFARHVWLVKQKDALALRLHTDPDYYDAKIAGWWCWGACAWIGTGWCSGEGPWIVEDGEIKNRQLPHLGNAGRGVNRKLPHLGDAGQGVNRKLPHLGDAGRGQHLSDYMYALRDALRGARTACGDWRRVVTPSVTTRHGLSAVILDPPYGEGAQEYSAGGNAGGGVAADVWAWAVKNGGDPLLRIAVCAYDDGRPTPAGWNKVKWAARKGYQTTDEAIKNPDREVVYFSPNCLDLNALPMFADFESELV
jgi:DNA adenine methylase